MPWYQHFQLYVNKFYVHMHMQLLSINECMVTHVNTLLVFIFQKVNRDTSYISTRAIFFFLPFMLKCFTSPQSVKQEPCSWNQAKKAICDFHFSVYQSLNFNFSKYFCNRLTICFIKQLSCFNKLQQICFLNYKRSYKNYHPIFCVLHTKPSTKIS